ncbi:MAG: hypothetical protein AMJ61_09085 [Desulfobacterales bacterium SG8_35_2]|nr:MAG: hypothetical protein AMJ61_09085 [Desulfobacterales bacterium SG8_35_2]
MDAYLSTGLGILVSLILFLLTYQQTIGAKRVRAKNANQDIHRSFMRRMVFEEYAPKFKDLTKIVEGKAREFKVSINDLLSEEQILNSLFTEVFDSDLISPSQRVEIENRLNKCLDRIEQEFEEPGIVDFRQLALEKKQKSENISILVGTASLLGATSSFAFTFIETKILNTELILSGVVVLVASVAVLSAISVILKNKEVVEQPSRRVAQMVSSELENEVRKILEKQKIKYSISPRLGGMRPAFVLDIKGKKVVIDAKAWNNVVPLHQIRRTTDYLNELANTEGVDQVLLVTNEKTPLPLSQINNDTISAITISELSSALQKAV